MDEQHRHANGMSRIAKYLRKRELRQDIRNLFLTATPAKLWAEFANSVQRRDWFRVECIAEIIVKDR